MVPEGAVSLDEANAAVEMWEHYSGKTLDQSQRLSVQVMMAQRAGERWAAGTTGRTVARQNGKGDEIEVVELWGLVQRAERILHTVHDAVLLASESQQRMLNVLERRAGLRNRIKRKWLGSGQQMIELKNGGQIWYRTRSKGGGRGVDEIDRLVLDEAQHAEPIHLASVRPTLLAARDPQVNAIGSAALDGMSHWWWSQRIRALKPDPGSFGWVEHSAESLSLDAEGRVLSETAEVTDPEVWRACNPALVAGRVEEEFFANALKDLGPQIFAQEHLNVWAPPPLDGGQSGPVDLEVWESLSQSSVIERGRAWALTVSPDRQWSALGAAGLSPSGKLHVEVREVRPGTGWVVDRCVEAFRQLELPVRVRKDGPEAALVGPLVDAGVEVVELPPAEMQRATGRFLDAVNTRTLAHIGQPLLNRSLEGVGLHSATSGAAVWSQRASKADITPLLAVTAALTGVEDAVEVDALSQIFV